MSKFVLYKQDNGKFAVVMPAPEALMVYGINEIAKKDVPSGKPYKIIEQSELPDTPQEDWEFDESNFNDGIGD